LAPSVFAFQEPDAAKRTDLLRRANVAMRADVALLFLLSNPSFYVHDEKIRGYERTAPPSDYAYDGVYRNG
jgi:hypothetical protein